MARARRQRDQRSFLLQRAQPTMTGLIDGSLSTLAPIFAVAFATHQPRYTFLAGLATAIGAGVSMAFSEGLPDTGYLTRARPPVLARRDHRRRRVPGRRPAYAAISHPSTDWRCCSRSRRSRSTSWRWPGFAGGSPAPASSARSSRSRSAGRSSPPSAPRSEQSDDRRRRFTPNPQERPRPSGLARPFSES